MFWRVLRRCGCFSAQLSAANASGSDLPSPACLGPTESIEPNLRGSPGADRIRPARKPSGLVPMPTSASGPASGDAKGEHAQPGDESAVAGLGDALVREDAFHHQELIGLEVKANPGRAFGNPPLRVNRRARVGHQDVKRGAECRWVLRGSAGSRW